MASLNIVAKGNDANPPQLHSIRAGLESLIASAIDLLDAIDGDADIEANGDETDHSFSEDCFIEHVSNGYPGCPISDPGGCQEWG